MITRRRFLSITAAALATSAEAAPLRWQGTAMGAEVSLTLHAPADQAERLLPELRRLLAGTEALFSLYEPSSQLRHLNRTGYLHRPDPRFLQLLGIADRVHAATSGIFDPSIQPIWRALAAGMDPIAATNLVGWEKARFTKVGVSLDRGQELTFNGIAQGFATDLLTEHLRSAGLRKALVNIGEFSAIGGPFRLGVADPEHGIVDIRRLKNRAIATSSPDAMRIGNTQSHILHPSGAGPAYWSTVSVEADSAAIADAASTAFCLMRRDEIRAALARLPGTPLATLVAPDGKLTRI